MSSTLLAAEQAIGAARSAGLRYVTDAMPGIVRVRCGSGFSYRRDDGAVVDDDAELARIRSLAIPPAYEDVWICPLAHGHIQATARDARGRKQYRYHPKWTQVRDGTKYDRMLQFAGGLARIRQRVEKDLALAGMPREKVLAAMVRLLDLTTMRVGNVRYAKENKSFGLTTLRNGHAAVEGQAVTFAFRGKSGVRHALSLRDRRLARIVRHCQEIPGQRLFEYIVDGVPHAVESSDVNEYLRAAAGIECTAKDFRTWVGSVRCAALLAELEAADTETGRKAQLAEVLRAVSRTLGNTPAVCRKSYVHPELLRAFQEGGALGIRALRMPARAGRLTADEASFLAFLRRGIKRARCRKAV